MSFGPKYLVFEQLEDQAKSIRPAVEHVKAMKHRDELDAEGRIKGLEAVRDELVERQAAVDAEIAQLGDKFPLRQRRRHLSSPLEGPCHLRNSSLRRHPYHVR